MKLTNNYMLYMPPLLYFYPQPCIGQKNDFLLYLWCHVHLPQDLKCTTFFHQLAHQKHLLQLVGILHHMCTHPQNVCTL